METIKVMLTQKQTAMLEELFMAVDADWNKGTPGMAVGQFFKSDDGEGFFEAGYVGGDKAKELAKALGMPEVFTGSRVYTVNTDIE